MPGRTGHDEDFVEVRRIIGVAMQPSAVAASAGNVPQLDRNTRGSVIQRRAAEPHVGLGSINLCGALAELRESLPAAQGGNGITTGVAEQRHPQAELQSA